MRILLSKTDALGDQVLATGLVRRLCEHHRPEVLVWMVREGYEAISDLLAGSRVVRPDVSASPFAEARRLLRSRPGKNGAWRNRVVVVPVPFDAYLPWPPGRDLAVEFGWWCGFLRELDIGLAIAGTIDLNWVDHALVAASGAVARIGTFRKELYPGLPEEVTAILRRESRNPAFTKVIPPLATRHELDSFAQLAARATGSLVPLLPDLHPAPVTGHRLTGGRILVAPGTGRAEKIYPVEKLAASLKHLVAAGICDWKDFLVVNGPADKEAVSGLEGAVRAVGGKLEAVAPADVGRLAGLLQASRALVCNDSFIAHLAAGLNVPAVAIWGSGHGLRFVPRAGRMVILQTDIPCAGCEWDCCLDKIRCVASLPLETLADAVGKVLRGGVQLKSIQRQTWPSPIQSTEAVARMIARRARDRKLIKETHDSQVWLKDAISQEATAREKVQALLKAAEVQRDLERAVREQEAAAKEKALAWAQAAESAKTHFQRLSEEAEAQRDHERVVREQEAAAKEKALAWAQAAESAKTHFQRLSEEAEAQRDHERVVREQEAAAKEKALAWAQAAESAKTRFQRLSEEAEVQRDHERAVREQEAAAKEKALAWAQAAESAKTRFQRLSEEAEVQRDHERAVREQEAAAKEKALAWAQAAESAKTRFQRLSEEAEVQRDHERAVREQEAAAKEKALAWAQAAESAKTHFQRLSEEAEVQRDHERAVREQEAAAKEKALAWAQSAESAKTHFQQLSEAAEAQRDHERSVREQEAAAKEKALAWAQSAESAKTHFQQLSEAAEAQRDHERSVREQEAAAKEKALAWAQSAESAKTHFQRLYEEAETQRDHERAVREQEAAAKEKALAWAQAAESAKTHFQRLYEEAETQRDHERTVREQEAAAKEKALALAQAAESAKTRFQRLNEEAESQRDAQVRLVVEGQRAIEEVRDRLQQLQEETDREREAAARQGAELAEITTRLARTAFAHDLSTEQARLLLRQRELLGRWLAFQNTVARWLRRAYCLIRQKPLVPDRTNLGPRVAQINTHDIIGGAERTSYDLHLGYRQRGLSPTLIVGGKYGADADVFKVPYRDIDWKPARIWRDRWGLTEVLYPTPLLGCFAWPQLRTAHIVHLHNMHGQFWNSATLLPLGMQHALVLTLHDEYTMTGDCCYTYDCERWTRGCGRCPQIGLERSARYSLGERDLTRLNIRIKRWIFRAPRAYPLVVVAPSVWLAERARRSPNLRHLPIVKISYGIDLNYWHPLPQGQARRALGLPDGKTIGLLVATHLSDRRKGFDVALDAIRRLPADTNLLFVLVGNITDEARSAIAGLPIIATGFVSEKIKMLNLFSASDFNFAMSRVDNLPYMCLESLACGRPVFGSAVGGIPEIVSEPALGWLAPQPFDSQRIADTLGEIDRESSGVRAQRFAACRRSAEARFSQDLMVERYLALYAELQAAAAQGRAVDPTKLAPASSPFP